MVFEEVGVIDRNELIDWINAKIKELENPLYTVSYTTEVIIGQQWILNEVKRKVEGMENDL